MADCIGQHFGDYRLVRLIGQGDFGEVFLGEHLRHSSQAAIKVLHTRLRGVDALRFHIEERRVYNLEHPHMVRLLDYDIKDDVPFLIMDYLPNGTLRQRYPEGTRLPLADIRSYVKQVADVLQYAHDRNLIHCGVKPENMLLGRNNAVLLSDFCLPLLVGSSYFQGKQVNYLAPEQIQGHPGPASDQYALGIIVYEWINGARPFDGSTPEIINKHLTIPPPPLRDKNPGLSNDIEQVVLRALAKDPKGRFPSVQDFARALAKDPKGCFPSVQDFANDLEAILSSHNFTRRDVVRWGLPILAGAITTTTIIAVVIESHANPPPTPTPNPTTRPSPTPPHPGTTIYTIDHHPANVFQVAWSPDGKHITAGWDNNMALVWDADSGNKVLRYNHHKGKVKTVAWSPTSRYIASGGFDNTVRVWDASSGSDILPPYKGHTGPVRSVAWSPPDGKHIASGSEDATVRVWDARTGRDMLPPYRGHNGWVLAVAWSPDGKYIASAGVDHTVRVWDASTGRDILPPYRGHRNWVHAVVWSPPDGQYIASGSYDHTVRIWNASTGSDILLPPYKGHSNQVEAVAWSSVGNRIASGGDDNTVRVWDASTGKDILPPYKGHHQSVWGVAWSPGGTRIASGSFDGTVQVWRAE